MCMCVHSLAFLHSYAPFECMLISSGRKQNPFQEKTLHTTPEIFVQGRSPFSIAWLFVWFEFK